MQELKPCPACGCVGYSIHNELDDYDNPIDFHVMCPRCDMRGPSHNNEAQCIDAWNTLTRALTWTTEPPKVPGFYFQEFMYGNKKNLQTIEVLPEDHWLHPKKKWEERNGKFDGLLHIGIGIGPIRKNARWAGPIQEPQEPKL